MNCCLFLTLFSGGRPVAWFLPVLLVLQVKPSCGGLQRQPGGGKERSRLLFNAVHLSPEVCLCRGNPSHVALPLTQRSGKGGEKGIASPRLLLAVCNRGWRRLQLQI